MRRLVGTGVRRFFLGAVVLLAVFGTAHADDLQTAREHFERGTRLYDLGQYADAAKEYEAAYKAKDDPALLFNCGQAYRGAGEPEKAIGFFKSFLRRMPEAPNRAEVEARIAELQRAVEIQHRSNSRPPQGTLPPSSMQIIVQTTHTTRPPSSDELRAARTKRIAGLGVGAAGIVALGVGGAFVGLANNANGHIVQGDMWSSGQQSARNGYEAGSIACFAVGGAAAVTGLVLYLVGRHEERRKYSVEQIQFTPAVGSHSAGASLTGSF
jgi:tetratricopeptide (TPR) repeat protein